MFKLFKLILPEPDIETKDLQISQISQISQIDDLPIELITEILSFCCVTNFSLLAQTCKIFLQCMLTRNFWISIYKKYNLNPYPICEPYYIPVFNFISKTWNPKYKSNFITITEDKTSVERSESNCSNPAVLTKRGLDDGSSITFQIIKLGKWLSLGLAGDGFNLDQDSVVGAQALCDNIGFYWHGSSSSIRGRLLPEDTFAVKTINEKIMITFEYLDEIKITRKKNKIKFFYNGVLVYTARGIYINTDLYPCASLSYNTEVKII